MAQPVPTTSSNGQGEHRDPLRQPFANRLRATNSMVSLDRESRTSAQSTGFEFQRSERRRISRQQTYITGKKSNINNFKGAPEPKRDLFIYRVDASTECEHIRNHVVDQDIVVHNIERLSHESSMFRSFKLTVGVSDYKRLLSDDIWPTGVRVRKYNMPRGSRYDDTHE